MSFQTGIVFYSLLCSVTFMKFWLFFKGLNVYFFIKDAEGSDGEFADDEILKLLRQRRKGYMNNLRY